MHFRVLFLSTKMENYNMRNPAVRRLMKEAEELCQPTDDYHAQPVQDNLFEWHFTLRGPPKTDFEGGIYHGKITLPYDYPMKPPSIILLTPNGRFETNKKICLSISDHHPESWQPSWSIRIALLAIIGFMPTPGNGAIGSLDYTPEERKALAQRSQNWKCPDCGHVKDIFVKKKQIKCLGSDDSPEPLVCSENKKNEYPNALSGSNNAEISTGKPLIGNSQGDKTSLVHRQKYSLGEESCDTTSSTPVSARQNHSNIPYDVLIYVILFIIAFLLLRRLCSV